MQRRSGQLWRMLGAVMLAALIVSCAEERGIGPQPIRERLYVGTWGPNSRVYVFDLAKDSLLDSTKVTERDMWASVASDGSYFVRHAGGPTCPELWDAKTLNFVTHLPDCDRLPVALAKDDLIAEIHNRDIDYYSFPSLAYVGADTLLPDSGNFLDFCDIDEERGLLFFAVHFGEGHTERSDVLVWDYRQRRLAHWWDFRPLLDKERVFISAISTSASENIFYAVIAYTGGGVSLIRFNYVDGQVVWGQSIPNSFAGIAVSPDRTEVWRYHRTVDPLGSGSIPYVFVHVAESGGLLDTIPLPRMFPDWPYSNSVQDIAFPLDGSCAYLAASSIHERPGQVFVVDIATHKVLDSLLIGGHYYPYTVDVAPAP